MISLAQRMRQITDMNKDRVAEEKAQSVQKQSNELIISLAAMMEEKAKNGERELNVHHHQLNYSDGNVKENICKYFTDQGFKVKILNGQRLKLNISW